VRNARLVTTLMLCAAIGVLLAIAIRQLTGNPAARYMSDVMLPIICVFLVILGIFFLTHPGTDRPSGQG
jgi:hypothetical protein